MNAEVIIAAVILAPGVIGAAVCLAGHHTAGRRDAHLAAVFAEHRTGHPDDPQPPGPGDPAPVPEPAPERVAVVIDLDNHRRAA